MMSASGVRRSARVSRWCFRSVWRVSSSLVAAMPATCDLRHPVDVDTPEDYARLTESGSAGFPYGSHVMGR